MLAPALWLALLPLTVGAPPAHGEITGVVATPPLAGVRILLKESTTPSETPKARILQSTVTGKHGSFSFSVEPGWYAVERKGCKLSALVDVTTGHTEHVRLRCSPSPMHR